MPLGKALRDALRRGRPGSGGGVNLLVEIEKPALLRATLSNSRTWLDQNGNGLVVLGLVRGDAEIFFVLTGNQRDGASNNHRKKTHPDIYAENGQKIGVPSRECRRGRHDTEKYAQK